MRVVLFDGILESHVQESLERALLKRGHAVHATGKIGHGFRFPSAGSDPIHLEAAVADAIDFAPDWVFVFRPASLPPELLARFHRHGIGTVAWLSDDPVLFDLSYGPVVEQYDRILHCGTERVLQFYEDFFRRPTGVNFPFWTDHHAFPAVWGSEPVESEAVFLGNVQDAVRRRRYFDLARLDDVRIHGKTGTDYFKLSAGYLDTDDEVLVAGARSRWAVNIPQFFADHQGLETWFPELGSLGFFEYPSRVIQYMAMGLPTITVIPGGHQFVTYPEMLVVNDMSEAAMIMADPKWTGDELRALSEGVVGRFERHFSAASRVLALEDFLADDAWSRLDSHERARWFTRFDGSTPLAPTPVAPAPIAVRGRHEPEHASDGASAVSPSTMASALVISSGEPSATSRASVVSASLPLMDFAVSRVQCEPGDSNVDLAEFIETSAPGMSLAIACADALTVSASTRKRFRESGIRTVKFIDGRHSVTRSNVARFSNFDILAFSDPVSARAFSNAGFVDATHVPHFVAPAFIEYVNSAPRADAVRIRQSAITEEAMWPHLSETLLGVDLAPLNWEDLASMSLAELAANLTSSLTLMSPSGSRAAPNLDSLFVHAWEATELAVVPRLASFVDLPDLAAGLIQCEEPGEMERKAWRYTESPLWRSRIEARRRRLSMSLSGVELLTKMLSKDVGVSSRKGLKSSSGLLESGSGRRWRLDKLLGQSRVSALITARATGAFGDQRDLMIDLLQRGTVKWTADLAEEAQIALILGGAVDRQDWELRVRYVGPSRNIAASASFSIDLAVSDLGHQNVQARRDSVSVFELIRPTEPQAAPGGQIRGG